MKKIFLSEQNYRKTTKTNSIEKAITNRHPVTFFYRGLEAKTGVRVKAEIVALGLSKKNNLIVRAYVQYPSVTKKGFDKTHWRTFIVNKMRNIVVHEDEQFTVQREQYKMGQESSKSPMLITYLTTKWDNIKEPEIEPEKEPEIEPEEIPKVEPKKEPETEPETKPEEKPKLEPDKEPKVEPETTYDTDNLPEPKVTEKPSSTPDTYEKDFASDVFKELESSVINVNNQKFLTTQDYEKYVRMLYSKKVKDWQEKQKSIGVNIKAGEGTRRKIEIISNTELSNLLNKNKIKVTNIIPQQLQESIDRIKSLMFKII